MTDKKQKFPNCEKYGFKLYIVGKTEREMSYWANDGGVYDEVQMMIFESALSRAEKRGYAKDRERVLDLLTKWRNGKYVMNDNAKAVIDEICDELWK